VALTETTWWTARSAGPFQPAWFHALFGLSTYPVPPTFSSDSYCDLRTRRPLGRATI